MAKVGPVADLAEAQGEIGRYLALLEKARDALSNLIDGCRSQRTSDDEVLAELNDVLGPGGVQ